ECRVDNLSFKPKPQSSPVTSFMKTSLKQRTLMSLLTYFEGTEMWKQELELKRQQLLPRLSILYYYDRRGHLSTILFRITCSGSHCLPHCIGVTDVLQERLFIAPFSGIWTSLSKIITLHSHTEFKPGQENVPIIENVVVGDASGTALGNSQRSFWKLGNETKMPEISFDSTNKFQLSMHDTDHPNDKCFLAMKEPLTGSQRREPLNKSTNKTLHVTYMELGATFCFCIISTCHPYIVVGFALPNGMTAIMLIMLGTDIMSSLLYKKAKGDIINQQPCARR
ncbi:LOW QUALITY PROTEIN: Potassium-transporting ATPase alpha chain 2, partial [Galemys pyrenaicus]